MTRTDQISFGEMKQLQVTVLQGIPDDLEPERVRGHIGSGKARLHEVLRLVLQSDLAQVDSTQLAALLSGRDRLPEKYADEEVEPVYPYLVLTGQLAKSPAEKLAVLAKHWPSFDGSHVQQLAEDILNRGALHEGEETLVTCPRRGCLEAPTTVLSQPCSRFWDRLGAFATFEKASSEQPTCG